MYLHEKPEEAIQCRVVLLLPSGDEVVVKGDDAICGPLTIQISGWDRTADAITRTLIARWKLNASIIDISEESGTASCFVVAELQGEFQDLPTGLRTIRGDALVSVISERERKTLEQILRGETTIGDPLLKRGWISNLRQAIAKQAPGHNLDFDEAIRHVNLSGPFALVRLSTTDGAGYWFKKVGAPNLHEFDLTIQLAKRFPQYVPTILCAWSEWKAWVSCEVTGPTLVESESSDDVLRAVEGLADLQKQSISALPDLVLSGARDATSSGLASLVEPFLEEMHHAMEVQTSTRSVPLTPSEIRQLGVEVIDLLDKCDQFQLPTTILHLDIGHGNVIASPDGPIFLDWAETFVGNPFITAEHLIADLVHAGNCAQLDADHIRRRYAVEWSDFVSASALSQMTHLSPVLGLIVYTLLGWDGSRKSGNTSGKWPLLRSLTRKIRSGLDLSREVA